MERWQHLDMAASTVIQFDTQAPVLSIGTPRRVSETEVAIPFESDEPMDLDATVEIIGQGIVPSTVLVDEIHVTNLPDGNIMLRVEATATDDVLNSANYAAEYPVLVFQMMARILVHKMVAAGYEIIGFMHARQIMTKHIVTGVHDIVKFIVAKSGIRKDEE